jgi:hypothetical protein
MMVMVTTMTVMVIDLEHTKGTFWGGVISSRGRRKGKGMGGR